MLQAYIQIVLLLFIYFIYHALPTVPLSLLQFNYTSISFHRLPQLPESSLVDMTAWNNILTSIKVVILIKANWFIELSMLELCLYIKLGCLYSRKMQI